MTEPFNPQWSGWAEGRQPGGPFKHIFVLHKKRNLDMQGKRVYIGRPSQWGNPFASKPSKVGTSFSLAEWQAKADPWRWLVQHKAEVTIKVETAGEAVELYEQFLRKMYQYDPFMRNELLIMARSFKEERENLLLICWCKRSPHDKETPCHGDTIRTAIEAIIAKGLV